MFAVFLGQGWLWIGRVYGVLQRDSGGSVIGKQFHVAEIINCILYSFDNRMGSDSSKEIITFLFNF